MEQILNSDLREQAGSNSFNRFDYQAHWIVYHMINEYKRGSEFFVFCEFHDDMAKTSKAANPDCAELFQIKTTEKYKEWTLSRLTNTTKKPNGNIKHSFLGFIFYNFLQFDVDCYKCHFVSNIGMDKQINNWQSIIEDEKELKEENKQLYDEIKKLIKSEFIEVGEEKFDSVFEEFIQNTHLYYGKLSLENYEKVVAGEFFQMLDTTEIYTSNSNKILRDIIEDVRKKSKCKVDMPISLKRLREMKGVSSEVFSDLKEQIKYQPNHRKVYSEIEEFLSADENSSLPQIKFIIRKLKQHHNKLLDVSNTYYLDKTSELIKTIDEIIDGNYEQINDLNFLRNKVMDKKGISYSEEIENVLVEAIFYERLLI